LCFFTALTGEATDVKVTETVGVDIDFNYVNSTADKVISETLLDADFTLQAQNVSMGNGIVEMKYFHRYCINDLVILLEGAWQTIIFNL